MTPRIWLFVVLMVATFGCAGGGDGGIGEPDAARQSGGASDAGEADADSAGRDGGAAGASGSGAAGGGSGGVAGAVASDAGGMDADVDAEAIDAEVPVDASGVDAEVDAGAIDGGGAEDAGDLDAGVADGDAGTGGSCKEGHYVGTFMGLYGSPVIFGAQVPVVATDTADGPSLELTLEKLPGSGEIFAIKGGKMRGNATGVATFTADFTGALDCATKKYVGTIENGEYIVLGNAMMPYHFVGTMTADYDEIQNAFINGIWQWTEPPSTTIPPGGDGQWTATWQSM